MLKSGLRPKNESVEVDDVVRDSTILAVPQRRTGLVVVVYIRVST